MVLYIYLWQSEVSNASAEISTYETSITVYDNCDRLNNKIIDEL